MPDSSKLTNLNSIDIRSNQIQDARFLQKLTNLNSLNISDNQIQDARFLQKLTNLNSLYISSNQIQDAAILKKLRNLRILGLSGNRLQDIPQGLIAGYNCLEHVKAWWAETSDANSTQKNQTVKLMLTGNGNAGKSTLFHALQYGNCPEEIPSTHGIMLDTWEAPPVSFVIWDFGGQEIYHGTHRLFMNAEALQLILIDPAIEKFIEENKHGQDRITNEETRDQPLDYWIETTRELSPHSILVVVQNKKDLDKERYKPAYQKAAKENLDYYHVSAREGDNIGLLRTFLQNKATELLEYGMPMPKSWIAARDYFLKNLQNKDTERIRLISKNDFFNLCKDTFGVKEFAIPSLLDLLHHNGVIYKNEEFLPDVIIADQRWALDAIYKPLKRGDDFYDFLRKESFGRTRVKSIFKAFGEAYQPEHKWLFLHFMRSCGLCFPLKERTNDEKETEESMYIFPEFLPEKMNISTDHLMKSKKDQMVFIRKLYPYLNYFRIQSFITKLGQKTQMENIWRNGIYIPTDQGDFAVYADYGKEGVNEPKSIVIAIEKTAVIKWLEMIIVELGREESKNFENNWEISEDGEKFLPIDLEDLKKRSKIEHGDLQRTEEAAPKTLPDELSDVTSEAPKNLVISYAKEDRWAVDALKKQMSPLIKEGKIIFWWDQERDGRRWWDDEINEKFENADGYVILVSPNYMDHEVKKYIHQTEIPIMCRRKDTQQIPGYCITVAMIDYGTDLGRFDYFSDKKPIPQNDSDRAEFLYRFVEEKIKKKFLKI